MSGNRKEVGPAPAYITCSPLARTFPPGWKDVWFRRWAKADEAGSVSYACPICQRLFDHRMMSYLHGDHVWPYSLFGETTWDNYQLICGDCNLDKSNRLDVDVRKALGADEFRQRVRDFLREQVERGTLAEDVVVRSLLGHVV